jgi:peptidoglycan hydrolase CwlO-like protein
VGKQDGSFVSSTTDEAAFDAAREFLNGFIEQAAAYKLSLDIKEQEEVVSDAEKKLDRLKDDEKDLNRKIERLQKELKDNQDDQRSQEKTVEKEKDKLSDLKKKQ